MTENGLLSYCYNDSCAKRVSDHWKRFDAFRCLKFQVASQCAPVLKGIKTSNIMTGRAGACRELWRIFRGGEIVCVPLYMGARRDVLLLYREALLGPCLETVEVSRFLRENGYGSPDLSSVIACLRRRYLEYMAGRRPFPHEMGVVLGYPVEDVESFIRCRGERPLFTGYWKVYHNRERAEKIFRLYDEARRQALSEILRGYSLENVAVRSV